MVVKKTGKGRESENQQVFHFHFSANPDDILPVEGGSQEELSDFEFRMRQILKDVLDTVAKRKTDPLDRFEVSARMSRKLGREITKDRKSVV